MPDDVIGFPPRPEDVWAEVEEHTRQCFDLVQNLRDRFGLGDHLDDAEATILFGALDLAAGHRHQTPRSPEERATWEELAQFLARVLSAEPWTPLHPWKEPPRFVHLLDHIPPLKED